MVLIGNVECEDNGIAPTETQRKDHAHMKRCLCWAETEHQSSAMVKNGIGRKQGFREHCLDYWGRNGAWGKIQSTTTGKALN